MTILAKPVSEGYVITPVALAVTDNPPADIYGQRWLLVLSGVAVCNFEGKTTNDWTRDTILIQPDINSALQDDDRLAQYPQAASATAINCRSRLSGRSRPTRAIRDAQLDLRHARIL